MPEGSFLLVSLEEEKAKILAQVLSNDTARNILNYLSRKENATETEISKALNIPLSTTHYNLGLLVKAGLASDEDYSYSEKGKQVTHFSLSNRYVIIAPKKTEALKKKMLEFLPVVFVATSAALLMKLAFIPLSTFRKEKPLLTVEMAVADESIRAIPSYVIQQQDFALWFLFGSVFALLVYFVWAEVILKRVRRKIN